MFPEIVGKDLETANAALVAARSGRGKGSGDADLIAAGAALVLARGVPGIIEARVPISASGVLDKSGIIGRKMNIALARCLQKDANAECAPGPPSASVARIVADVSQQISAMKIMAAVGNSSFLGSLNAAQKQLAEQARNDEAFRSQMSALSKGDFHKLSPDMAGAVEEALSMPQQETLAREMRSLSPVIDSAAHDREAARQVSFQKFSEIDQDQMERIEKLHRSGASTGVKRIDQAVKLVSDRVGLLEDGLPFPVVHKAQARLLSRGGRFGNISPVHMAATIMSDVAIMEAATREMLVSPHPSGDAETIAQGNYETLPLEKQQEICGRIDSARHTPALMVLETSSRLDLGRSQGISALDVVASHPEVGR